MKKLTMLGCLVVIGLMIVAGCMDINNDIEIKPPTLDEEEQPEPPVESE